MSNKPAKRKPSRRQLAQATPLARPAGIAAGKVAVAYLHPEWFVSPIFMRSMVNLLVRDAYLNPGRIVRPIEYQSGANVSLARNKCVEAFLEHFEKPEWLLFIDADMGFADDLLDVMLSAADPVERPIIGGLCFGVGPVKLEGQPLMNAQHAYAVELFPTIFTQDAENECTIRWVGYPKDAVFGVGSTGAACLLIHRRVLADPRWLDDGHPLPWFRESVLWGDICSEDHFFCIKAAGLGYPTYVDSRAKTSHHKSFLYDESTFVAQQDGKAWIEDWEQRTADSEAAS